MFKYLQIQRTKRLMFKMDLIVARNGWVDNSWIIGGSVGEIRVLTPYDDIVKRFDGYSIHSAVKTAHAELVKLDNRFKK